MLENYNCNVNVCLTKPLKLESWNYNYQQKNDENVLLQKIWALSCEKCWFGSYNEIFERKFVWII